MNYYYTVSSLPYLRYEEAPPFSREEFLRLCAVEVRGRDMEVLENASIYRPEPVEPSCRVLDRWVEWEGSLRDALVGLRASRLGVDGGKFVKGFPVASDTLGVAKAAVSKDDPMEAEEALNRARWRFLDDLEGRFFFDVNRLVAYLLKLELLLRMGTFEEEKGKERLESLVSALERR